MDWDLIIIGGGPAGLTAGLYASRAKVRTLLMEKLISGGQMTNTTEIENYPGTPKGTTGTELAFRMEEQAKEFGLKFVSKKVDAVKIQEGKKLVLCGNEVYTAKSILIASGAEPRKLQVPGEEEYIGRGVSYCATCDGAFFSDKDIIVVGGGDTAIEEALFLTRYARKVKVIHRRDKLRATQILQERAFKNKNIEFIWDSVVKEIKGTALVEEVILENVKTGELTSMPIDGIFVAVGYVPDTKFLEGLITLDSNGYIITNENMETNIPGIFAAGDIRKKPLRQVVTAASDGAIAAVMASNYIENLG